MVTSAWWGSSPCVQVHLFYAAAHYTQPYSLSYSQRLGDMMSQHIVFCGQCFAHAVYQMLQIWAGKVFDKITVYQ